MDVWWLFITFDIPMLCQQFLAARAAHENQRHKPTAFPQRGRANKNDAEMMTISASPFYDIVGKTQAMR